MSQINESYKVISEWLNYILKINKEKNINLNLVEK